MTTATKARDRIADRALPKASSRCTKGLSNSNGGYRPMQIAPCRRALYVLMGQWHRANLARALHFCSALPPALVSLAFPLPADFFYRHPFSPSFCLSISLSLPPSLCPVYQGLPLTQIEAFNAFDKKDID